MSRTREQDFRYVMTTSRTWYPIGGTPQTAYMSETVGDRNVMTDVVIENFHERKSKGEVFFNPCTKEKTSLCVTPAAGSVTNSNGYYAGEWVGFYTSGGSFIDFDTNIFTDEASIQLTSAYAKVTSNEAALLCTLGEAKETKDMLLGALSKVGHIRKLLNLYYLAKRAKNLSLATDIWLQIRYGWMPLYYDIQSIRKALDKKDSFPPRQTFRAAKRQITDDKTVYTTVTAPDKCFHWTKRVSYTADVSAGVLAAIRFSGFPDTWGLTKIPQTIWELTTLSFVIDWVFNVGDTIAAWTPDTLWTPLGSWTTIKVLKEQSVIGSSYHLDPSVNWRLSDYKRRLTTQTYIRNPATTRNVFPSFSFNMNWKRYIDAVALSRSSFEKALRKLL